MRLEQASHAVTVVRLEGVFDGPAARRLEALLVDAGVSARIHVDLTHVREFHDFAIAVLGQALTRTRASVSLRGLRQHQIVVLRYFGIDPAPLESAVTDAA
jgi:anti-anti-sigma regulatory factor